MAEHFALVNCPTTILHTALVFKLAFTRIAKSNKSSEYNMVISHWPLWLSAVVVFVLSACGIRICKVKRCLERSVISHFEIMLSFAMFNEFRQGLNVWY
eukprot:16436512-Heterocapsa_arctica.AAC.1